MTAVIEDASPCPCGLPQTYAGCCQRYHDGKPVPTALALMRSRYSAFVLKFETYLLQTWHPDTRPGTLDLTDSPQWIKLQVIDHAEEKVHFRAYYKAGSGIGYLDEKSRFRRENNRWFYVDGDTSEGRVI